MAWLGPTFDGLPEMGGDQVAARDRRTWTALQLRFTPDIQHKLSRR
ncbi:MAG: hypothetical protein WBD22_02355 [Pyrinomonadaceae bacterium]